MAKRRLRVIRGGADVGGPFDGDEWDQPMCDAVLATLRPEAELVAELSVVWRKLGRAFSTDRKSDWVRFAVWCGEKANVPEAVMEGLAVMRCEFEEGGDPAEPKRETLVAVTRMLRFLHNAGLLPKRARRTE